MLISPDCFERISLKQTSVCSAFEIALTMFIFIAHVASGEDISSICPSQYPFFFDFRYVF